MRYAAPWQSKCILKCTVGIRGGGGRIWLIRRCELGREDAVSSTLCTVVFYLENRRKVHNVSDSSDTIVNVHLSVFYSLVIYYMHVLELYMYVNLQADREHKYHNDRG